MLRPHQLNGSLCRPQCCTAVVIGGGDAGGMVA